MLMCTSGVDGVCSLHQTDKEREKFGLTRSCPLREGSPSNHPRAQVTKSKGHMRDKDRACWTNCPHLPDSH